MDYSSCSSELDESNKSYRSENSILCSSFENRPYQCPICDEEFFEENELNQHTTIAHHRVLQYHNSDISDVKNISGFITQNMCLICDCEFGTKSEAVSHVKENHLDVISQSYKFLKKEMKNLSKFYF